jgi:hypothetical protein
MGMILANNTSLRHRGMVGIAAVIFAVLSTATSAPGQTGPNITAQGFLLDDGIFSTIDHPDAASSTVAFGVNNRSQTVQPISKSGSRTIR